MAEKRTQVNVTGASGSLGELTGSVEITVSPKPLSRWQRFMDLNWKMGKPILKEGAREAVVEFIKWLVSSRKRQPARGFNLSKPGPMTNR